MQCSCILRILIALLAIAPSKCDIPTAFEICSVLLSNGKTNCSRTTCQGSPGKKGVPGARGPPGIKGDKGADEHFDSLLVEFGKMKDDFDRLRNAMPFESKIDYCAMGMKSGKIPDSAISVSSSHSSHGGRYARLDKERKTGMHHAGWHTAPGRYNMPGEWIQIDFGAPKLVSGLVTQGRPDYAQWVTSYKVACGTSTGSLRTLTENGQEKVFSGNNDQNTKVVNMFSSPVTCRYIRIYPRTWKHVQVLRLEFLRGDCVDAFRK